MIVVRLDTLLLTNSSLNVKWRQREDWNSSPAAQVVALDHFLYRSMTKRLSWTSIPHLKVGKIPRGEVGRAFGGGLTDGTLYLHGCCMLVLLTCEQIRTLFVGKQNWLYRIYCELAPPDHRDPLAARDVLDIEQFKTAKRKRRKVSKICTNQDLT